MPAVCVHGDPGPIRGIRQDLLVPQERRLPDHTVFPQFQLQKSLDANNPLPLILLGREKSRRRFVLAPQVFLVRHQPLCSTVKWEITPRSSSQSTDRCLSAPNTSDFSAKKLKKHLWENLHPHRCAESWSAPLASDLMLGDASPHLFVSPSTSFNYRLD